VNLPWPSPLPGQPAIHAALARLRHAGDALFALAVLAVVVLLVAPVPPPLLDAGQALSLALGATLLSVTLLARDALASPDSRRCSSSPPSCGWRSRWRPRGWC